MNDSDTPTRFDPVIQCPRCRSNRPSIVVNYSEADDDNSLRCDHCGVEFKWDARDYFFVLSGSTHEETQQRSLLVHQKQDLYCNAKFKSLIWEYHSLHMRAAFQRCRPAVILDVGCGDGAYLHMLRGLYQNYYGLEPSEIPESRRLSLPPKPNAVLIHYDANQALPIHNQSVDLAAFIASYDHIPTIQKVIRDTWDKIKPGGGLLIIMTNHGFWAKRLLSLIMGRSFLENEDEHFCVHNPTTLDQEIRKFVPGAKLDYVDSDYFFLPNLPHWLSPIYFSKTLMQVVNGMLALFNTKVLGKKDLGSVMIVVFRKEAGSAG